MDALTLIIEGEIPRPMFKRDMCKEASWELVKDTREPIEIAVGDLELATFLNHDEQFVMGEEMAKRAKNIGAMLGQRHAELLLEHQDQIPGEWRKYYILFPGTVWRGRDDGLFVPCLRWRGGRWCLPFRWLDCRFDSSGRLLRPRK